MARSEARLKFSIWRGLRGASPPAKLLYNVLLTDDSVNYAGVGRYCPELWAENAEMPVDRIEKALAELVGGGWVVVDGFSFLVRTMIRNDGIAEQPNMLKAALREAQQVHSATIRKVLATELRKLPPKRPDTVKAGKSFTHPDPHAVADELDPLPPPPAPKGSSTGMASEKGSEGPQDPWSNPSPEPFQGTLATIPSGDGSAEGMSERPGGRGGGGGRGVSPVTENSTSTEPPSAGAEAPQPDNRTDGQLLIAHWLDQCRKRPPGNVIGQAGKAIAAMLDEGIAFGDIQAGIDVWASKGLNPASLPSVVNEVMNARPQLRLAAGGVPQQGTASQRSNAFLALRKGGEPA